MMPTKHPKLKSIAMRFDLVTVGRLQGCLQELKRRPGMEGTLISTSDLIRMVVARGLPILEQELKIETKKGERP